MNDRTAVIFCIGRELLEGQVLDRNAHYMASHLARIGFRVSSIQVLDDVRDEVVTAFRHAIESKPAYIMVTGGMGPAHNDITREATAEAAGLELVRDPNAEELLASSYRRMFAKGRVDSPELNEARLKMATIPAGATCFENLGGTAPALSLEAGESTFFLMPGQPEELRQLFDTFVQPLLEAATPGGYRESQRIDVAGGDESAVTRLLELLHRRHPTVQYRARRRGDGDDATVRITLTVEGPEQPALHQDLLDATADLRARLGLEVG